MSDLFADVGYYTYIYSALRRYGGNYRGQEHEELVVVLADGLGSGVKANILSTLTSKIISTMIAAGMSVDDCVKTIAATLPVCRRARRCVLHLHHHAVYQQHRGRDHPI